MCGAHVKCAKCGNNCCNGGYGILNAVPNTPRGSTGEECDACPSAYELQDDWKSCPRWLRIRTRLHMFIEFDIYIPLRNKLDHYGIDLDYWRGRSDRWPEILVEELNEKKKK